MLSNYDADENSILRMSTVQHKRSVQDFEDDDDLKSSSSSKRISQSVYQPSSKKPILDLINEDQEHSSDSNDESSSELTEEESESEPQADEEPKVDFRAATVTESEYIPQDEIE